MIAAALTAFVSYSRIWQLDAIGLIALALLLIWVVPFIKKHGFEKHMKLALMISGVHFIFASYRTFSFYLVIMNAKSLEGPNGEGSPLAVIIELFIFGLLTVMPWVLACMMGFRAVSEISEAKR